MTRRTPIVFIFPLMLLAAGACVADSKPASENQSTVVATQVEASPLPALNPTMMLPTVTDATCCFSGMQPAPLGYAIPLGDGRLVIGVLEVTRPANDIIAQASPNNPVPNAGSEYLMAKVLLQCIAESSDTDNPCDLGLGVLFRVRDQTDMTVYEEAGGLAEVPDRFELPNINAGFTASGNVAFLVPTSARDLVLWFSWPNNTDVILALE
jgi:hypothetical protein